MTEYRPLVAADIPQLIELATLIWHTHYPGIISTAQIDYMLAQRYSAAAILASLTTSHWLVAQQGEHLRGFANAFATDHTIWKLDKLYVHPDHQRQGMGCNLVLRVAKTARLAGATQLVLRVNKHNQAAIHAYKKYGFCVAGEDKLAIGEGYVMDDYLMQLPLSTDNSTDNSLDLMA